MKSIILASLLVTIPVLAFAGSNPMTMKCDIKYRTWVDGNDQHEKSDDLPVKMQLQLKTPTEYYGKVVHTTYDGRFEIVMDAIQPLPGDSMPMKIVRISITDKTSDVNVEDSYLDQLTAAKDVLTASKLVTVNLNNLSKPGGQLSVLCNLVD